jgi:hypothetical protein
LSHCWHVSAQGGRMTDKEVMQMALDALDRSDYLGWEANIPAMKALRAALAQPKREWVGLTDEEMMELYIGLKCVAGFYSLGRYARSVEAKLKEKNT